MSRLRFHPLLVVLLLGCPQSVKSQEIQIGAPPIGVQASLGHDAYSVIGTSAQSILDQLEANGWTRFSVAYRYRWKNEPVPLTNGMPSNKCRPFDFEILFDFTTRYPQWDRPPDAIPELIAAWDAFAAEVEAQWEQYRDDVVGRGRAVARRLRRFEDDCAFVSDRVREQVREQMDERDPITAQEPRLRIQWPPEGHTEVLREERIANREAARGERTAEGRARDSEAGTPDASSGRALPVTEPAVFPAASIDLAFSMDLADGATGLVVDLHHLGNPQFREAIDIDPNFALGYAGLADAYS